MLKCLKCMEGYDRVCQILSAVMTGCVNFWVTTGLSDWLAVAARDGKGRVSETIAAVSYMLMAVNKLWILRQEHKSYRLYSKVNSIHKCKHLFCETDCSYSLFPPWYTQITEFAYPSVFLLLLYRHFSVSLPILHLYVLCRFHIHWSPPHAYRKH